MRPTRVLCAQEVTERWSVTRFAAHESELQILSFATYQLYGYGCDIDHPSEPQLLTVKQG